MHVELTETQELEHHAAALDLELGGAAPGERGLLDQPLGWSYILNGGFLLFMVAEAYTAFGGVEVQAARNVVAAVVSIGVGIGLDRGRSWRCAPPWS